MIKSNYTPELPDVSKMPHINDVSLLRRFTYKCPVCDTIGCVYTDGFKYEPSIRLTGAVRKCFNCGGTFFIVQPEKP